VFRAGTPGQRPFRHLFIDSGTRSGIYRNGVGSAGERNGGVLWGIGAWIIQLRQQAGTRIRDTLGGTLIGEVVAGPEWRRGMRVLSERRACKVDRARADAQRT